MGAGRVIAPGRNQAALDLLADRFGPRVRPVPLTGDDADDRTAMSAAAGGPIDMVIDLLPPGAPSSVTRTAAMTVREYGRVVLMGGVGMLGGDDLALPYPWIMRNSITVRGQWMYPRSANVGIIRLLASGALDLTPERVRSFRLHDVNDGVTYAAAHGGPFDRTALTPPSRSQDRLIRMPAPLESRPPATAVQVVGRASRALRRAGCTSFPRTTCVTPPGRVGSSAQ
ncbi:hypothetical protein QFZ63_000028 [Streptomyces sp. B3I7]|nr:hypothetical protein [Streptomyces sp. B3I7]